MDAGTCGVLCARCPRKRVGKCSGCNPNPFCGIPDCAKKKGLELCFDCAEFPCGRHYGEKKNLVIYDRRWLDFIRKETEKK